MWNWGLAITASPPFSGRTHLHPKLKLAIAVPWTTEMGWTRSWKSIARLGFFKHPENCEMELFGGPELGDGWCSARRHNACLEQAVLWGADAILILGADQKYQPDMIAKLVDRYRNGCDCVAANVNIRGHVANQGTKPFQSICWRVKPDEDGNIRMGPTIKRGDIEFVTPANGDCVQINGCGSGVLMFPTDALKDIKAPWFTEEPVMPTFARKACADWPFVSRLQREAKLKIWCDTTIKVTHIHPFEIDDTFSERFADWEDKGDPNCCEREDPDKNMIRQCRVSPSIPFYADKFPKKYGLNPYTTPFTPAFFFGCYTREDLKVIQEHTSTAVVIWAGTDALTMRKALEGTGKHPFGPNVYHIAISKFIADDLDALGIPYKRLPLNNVDEDKFKPVPRGTAVYCYCPDHDREKYGGKLLDEVMALMPDKEFIVQRTLDPNVDMPAIYAKCGVGLRLLEHDGLSNTVVELGLMGRRVLWKGDTPNTNDYTVVAPHQTEAYLIKFAIDAILSNPSYHDEISQGMKEYLALPPNWKSIHYYAPQSKPMLTMTPELAAKPYDYEEYFEFRYGQGPTGAGGPDPKSPEVQWTNNKILELLEKYDCESVVEVGCGAMVRWDDLPRKKYIGIDVSATAISHAMKKLPAIYEHRNVAKKGIGADSDAVLCLDVLQHITPEDLPIVIDELVDRAKKVVIIKTSVGIPNLKYQFSHDWKRLATNAYDIIDVPGVPHAKMFVFQSGAINASLRDDQAGDANEASGRTGATPTDAVPVS